jgi:hypothetical protein
MRLGDNGARALIKDYTGTGTDSATPVGEDR